MWTIDQDGDLVDEDGQVLAYPSWYADETGAIHKLAAAETLFQALMDIAGMTTVEADPEGLLAEIQGRCRLAIAQALGPVGKECPGTDPVSDNV